MADDKTAREARQRELRTQLKTKLAELEQKHGGSAGYVTPDNRILALVPPSEEAYVEFFNGLVTVSDKSQVRRMLALKCTAYPAQDEASKILSRYPALAKKASEACERMAGSDVEESAPSAEHVAKYGEDIAVFGVLGRTLVYGTPSEGDYDRCSNTIESAKDRYAVLRELLVCSLKEPSIDDALLTFKKYPALVAACCPAVQRLGGTEIEELGKD